MNTEANHEGLRGKGRKDLGYTLSLPSGPFRVKLPYVIGILADLRPSPVNGNRLLDYQHTCGSWLRDPSENTLPNPRDRMFHKVTDSSFQAFMAFMAPELSFSVPNIVACGGELGVQLSFRSLGDFTPEVIAAQVPELHDSVKVSSHEPGLESRAVREQLALILKNETLAGLTRTWRSIRALSREIQPDGNVQLRVMHISKKELSKDLRKFKGMRWDTSPLFKKLQESEYGRFGGEPYDCVIPDFHFDHTPPDVELLGELSKIAAAGHFVVLAAAAPTLLQLKSWGDFNPDFDAHLQMAAGSYTYFRSFRESEDSRYVFLTMPGVRSQDANNGDSPAEFTIADKKIENSTPPATINPSYLVAATLARCFREAGWFVPQSGESRARMNAREQRPEGRSECGHEAESRGDSASAKLSDLGLNRIPGTGHRHTRPGLLRSLYCRTPSVDGPTAVELAGLSSLAYMSCANHIIHYVHSIVRDLCPEGSKGSDCFRLVMKWLNRLSTGVKDGQNLLTVTASALAEGECDIFGLRDEARIELEFNRGFAPPGPKLRLLAPMGGARRRTYASRSPDVVVGVLMDLSLFSEHRPEIAERKFQEIDVDNFDERVKSANCRVAFKVQNLIDGQGKLYADLKIGGLFDLEPGRVAGQIIPLARLLDDRNSLTALAAFADVHRDRIATLKRVFNVPEGAAALRSKIEALVHDLRLESPPTERSAFDYRLQAWAAGLETERGVEERTEGLNTLGRLQEDQPGQCVADGVQGLRRLIEKVDGLVGRQLDHIFHHRDFQLFESTWRGLWHLVSSFRGNHRVRIRYIDVSKEECFLEQADLESGKPLVRDKSIYGKLAREKEWFGGEPFDILISDYRFTGSAEDLVVLHYLQMIADELDATMYTSIEPDLLGFQSWNQLDATTAGNLAWTTGIAERFERDYNNRHLVLCAPEVHGRLPYKSSPEGIREFQYAEYSTGVDSRLWCRPAFWAAEAGIRQRLSETGTEPQVNPATDGMSETSIGERIVSVPKYAWDNSVRAALRRLGVETPPFEGDPSRVRPSQGG